MTQYSFCFTYRISNFLNFHQEISFLKKCAWVPQNVNHSFQILTLTLSHPPPTNTSLGVWIWTSAHSHRERGWIQDYLIFTSHHASAVISGWICWICRCATIGASVVGVELQFDLHIVLGLPDHPHEETLREVHGEWFVTLDAILKEESDRSPVLRGFGRFSAFCAQVWW